MRPKFLKQVGWLDEVPALLWRAFKKIICAASLLPLALSSWRFFPPWPAPPIQLATAGSAPTG